MIKDDDDVRLEGTNFALVKYEDGLGVCICVEKAAHFRDGKWVGVKLMKEDAIQLMKDIVEHFL